MTDATPARTLLTHPGRSAVFLTLFLAAATLTACDLTGTMDVSSSGQADLHLEIGIERSLLDGEELTCQQVMNALLDGFLPDDTGAVAQVDDADSLRCTLDAHVDLADQGWDGESGRPLWAADANTGEYRLYLPFSQGTGSGGLTESDLKDLGLDGDVSLAITMPANITSASIGEVSGNTVTATGVRLAVTDLDVRCLGSSEQGDVTPVIALVGMILIVIAGALVLIIGQRRHRRRLAQRSGRSPSQS